MKEPCPSHGDKCKPGCFWYGDIEAWQRNLPKIPSLVTIRIDSVDTHMHVTMFTNGALNGVLTFLPIEFFEFDAALQKAYPSRYVLLNTTLLEPFFAERRK